MNAVAYLSRYASTRPGQTALVFEDKGYTYEDLDRAVSRMAGGLCGLGVEKEDRVAIILPNGWEWVVAYHAIIRIGAVAVSINGSLKPRSLGSVLRDCCPQAIFAPPAIADCIPCRSFQVVLPLLGLAEAGLVPCAMNSWWSPSVSLKLAKKWFPRARPLYFIHRVPQALQKE